MLSLELLLLGESLGGLLGRLLLALMLLLMLLLLLGDPRGRVDVDESVAGEEFRGGAGGGGLVRLGLLSALLGTGAVASRYRGRARIARC